MNTMTTATATTLADIPRESIERIEWVGKMTGRRYWMRAADVDGFIWRFKNEPMRCDGGNVYRSTRPEFPYEFFEVFVK